MSGIFLQVNSGGIYLRAILLNIGELNALWIGIFRKCLLEFNFTWRAFLFAFNQCRFGCGIIRLIQQRHFK